MAQQTSPSPDLFSDDDIPVVQAASRPKAKPVAPSPFVRTPSPALRRPAPPAASPAAKKTLPAVQSARLPMKAVPEDALHPALPRTNAAATLARAPLQFSSPGAKARCELVGETYLRGIRTEAQTREKLTLPVEHGGAGLSQADAGVCIGILSEALQKASAKMAEDLAQQKAAYLDRTRAKMRAEAEGRPLTPAPKVVPVAKPAKTEAAAGAAAVDAPPVAAPRQTTPPTIVAKAELMSDVQHAPKLVGPVEELSSMTLEDFRRLGRRPEEAVRKIREKLALLAGQSYESKMKGVVAWQAGQVNRLYLEFLRAALSGTSPEAAAAERKGQGLPYLTKEEFASLMALSQELKY